MPYEPSIKTTDGITLFQRAPAVEMAEIKILKKPVAKYPIEKCSDCDSWVIIRQGRCCTCQICGKSTCS